MTAEDWGPHCTRCRHPKGYHFKGVGRCGKGADHCSGYVDELEATDQELDALRDGVKRIARAAGYGEDDEILSLLNLDASDAESVAAIVAEQRAELVELRERVDGDAWDRLTALAATCRCGSTYETYEGPEADCPVHGAVKALNDVTEQLVATQRVRDGWIRATNRAEAERARLAATVERVEALTHRADSEKSLIWPREIHATLAGES